MTDIVLDFIRRRFPVDNHWCDGNCYYFATILHARFPDGKIYYDVIDNHFFIGLDGKFYDWTGEIQPDGYVIEWDKCDEYDSNVKKAVIRDCIL